MWMEGEKIKVTEQQLCALPRLFERQRAATTTTVDTVSAAPGNTFTSSPVGAFFVPGESSDAPTITQVQDIDTPASSHEHQHQQQESSRGQAVTVQARAVQEEELVHAKPVRPLFQSCGLVILISGLIVGVAASVLAVYASLSDSEKDPRTSTNANSNVGPLNLLPTLPRVKEKGVLRCGINSGVKELVQMFGHLYGIDMFIDEGFCRAASAAVLGDPNALELSIDGFQDSLDLLSKDEIDVAMLPWTEDMGFDMGKANSTGGFTVSPPLGFSLFSFFGVARNVDCADAKDVTGDCSDTLVCNPIRARSFGPIGIGGLPRSHVIIRETAEDTIHSLLNGECNVILGPKLDVYDTIFDFSHNTKLSHKTQFIEYLAIVTRDGDLEWSRFLTAAAFSLLAAEQAGISKENAHKFPETDLFGPEHSNMFAWAISAEGNYGDLWRISAEPLLPRGESGNRINAGMTGLHLPLEIEGSYDYSLGPGPVKGGTLESILLRNRLLCAVRDRRPGFATWDSTTGEWRGMDVDYCRALAAGLFHGDMHGLDVIPVANQSEAFSKLANGLVDVAAGVEWTIRNSISESTTGAGYAFSRPYFYAPIGAFNSSVNMREDNLCLATRPEDQQWSSFVYYTVANTFSTEDQNVTSLNADSAPLVEAFGIGFPRMLMDATLKVGNYGEIYARNLEPLLPRSGRNLLARMLYDRTPNLYAPKGFFG